MSLEKPRVPAPEVIEALVAKVRPAAEALFRRHGLSAEQASESLEVDLVVATKTAIQEMIDFLVATKGLDRRTAYQLTSIAGNVAITEFVDSTLGVHVKPPKSIFRKGRVVGKAGR